MKTKIIFVVTLLAISAWTAWLWPMVPDPSSGSGSSHAKTTAELELENQLRLAKVDLHKAASDYLLNLEKMRRNLLMAEVQWRARSSEQCTAMAAMGHSCPMPNSLDQPRLIADIKQSAYRLQQAEYEFKSKVKSFRHDMCNKLGYLCKWTEKDSAQRILADMPITILDTEIDQALKLLPRTREIMQDMLQKHISHISSSVNS